MSDRDWINHPTILSGNIGNLGCVNHNSYHVVYVDGTSTIDITSTCVIDGLVLQDAYANDLGNRSGGGILIDGRGDLNAASTTIRNTRFSNIIADKGGAIRILSDELGISSPSFTSCVFNNNMETVNVNTENIISNGGAVSVQSGNPNFNNCIFAYNNAENDGDHIYAIGEDFAETDVSTVNCTFLSSSFTGDFDIFSPGIFSYFNKRTVFSLVAMLLLMLLWILPIISMKLRKILLIHFMKTSMIPME